MMKKEFLQHAFNLRSKITKKINTQQSIEESFRIQAELDMLYVLHPGSRYQVYILEVHKNALLHHHRSSTLKSVIEKTVLVYACGDLWPETKELLSEDFDFRMVELIELEKRAVKKEIALVEAGILLPGYDFTDKERHNGVIDKLRALNEEPLMLNNYGIVGSKRPEFMKFKEITDEVRRIQDIPCPGPIAAARKKKLTDFLLEHKLVDRVTHKDKVAGGVGLRPHDYVKQDDFRSFLFDLDALIKKHID